MLHELLAILRMHELVHALMTDIRLVVSVSVLIGFVRANSHEEIVFFCFGWFVFGNKEDSFVSLQSPVAHLS